MDECNEIASGTLFPKVDSWINGSNVDGKAVSVNFYMAGMGAYVERMRAIAANDYEGFAVGAVGLTLAPVALGAGGAEQAVEVRLAGRRGHAAVDDEVVPGDVRRVVGGEEGDRRGDLLRSGRAGEGHETLVLRAESTEHAVEHRRGDGSGTHGVDAHAVAGVIEGEGAREVGHRALRRAVRSEAVVAGEPRDRAGVDDAAATGREVDHRRPGGEEHRVEVDGEDPVPLRWWTARRCDRTC